MFLLPVSPLTWEQRHTVDRLLVLLSRRLQTAEDVAKAKYNVGAPTEDLPRERAVVEAAAELARRRGVEDGWVSRVFAAQIEASKDAQRAFRREWTGRPPFDPVPNLAQDVRPRLDLLTPAIVVALKEAEPILATADGTAFVRARAVRFVPAAPAYRQAWSLAVEPLLKRRP